MNTTDIRGAAEFCRPHHSAGYMRSTRFTDESVGELVRTAPNSMAALRRRLQTWSRSRGLVPVGLLLGCAAVGCNRHADGMGPPQRPPAPVTVATAATRDVPVYLDEIGKCAAIELVIVQ